MPSKRIALNYKKGKYSFSKFNPKRSNRKKINPVLTEKNAKKLKQIVKEIRTKNLNSLKDKAIEIDKTLLKNKRKLFNLQNKIDTISLKIKTIERKLKTEPNNKQLLKELQHLKDEQKYAQLEFNAVETIIKNLSEEKELTNRDISELKNPNKRKRFKTVRLKKQSLQTIFEALRILERNGDISKEEFKERATIFLKLQNKIELTEKEKETFEELTTDLLFYKIFD